MANCKACGAWFSSTALSELCPTCERALKRLNGYVVSMGVHEQVRWERDIAIEQLESYGISLGEKADAVKVVRCKDCKYCRTFYPVKEIGKEAIQVWYCDLYRCNRKTDEFCSDGERREGE